MRTALKPPCKDRLSSASTPRRLGGPVACVAALAWAQSVGCARFGFEILSEQPPGAAAEPAEAARPIADAALSPANGSKQLPAAEAGLACELGTIGHCSACGDSCNDIRLPGVAALACVDRLCSVASCTSGRGDCDGNRSNGCETQLLSTENCGGCGALCSFDNAQASCIQGSCQFGCLPGFEDCDADPSNGCEAQLLSTENCGDCGALCSFDNAQPSCIQDSCQFSCLPGFDDCDADPSNGCERPIQTLTDCGACDLPCAHDNAIASCQTGSCQRLACLPGFGDCDADPANGCERSIQTLTDCGACNLPCAYDNAIASCQTGSCQRLACSPGFGDCDADPSNGCEARLDTLVNCGGCAQPCEIPGAATLSCAGGSCTAATCAAGLADCNADGLSCETSLSTLDDCGGCGDPCGDPIGRLAQANASCASGSCEVANCDPDWADCDGTSANGCETSTTTLSDCGDCGVACSRSNATASCATGSCAIGTCDAGWADCDAVEANGCEMPLGGDSSCGGCGDACSAGYRCREGTCIPDYPYAPSNFDPAQIDANLAVSVNLDCGSVVLNTDTLSANTWCGSAPPPIVHRLQIGGPDIVVVSVLALQISPATTLSVVGSRAVVFAVHGDALIGGTITASAAGTTAGPGGNWACASSQGENGKAVVLAGGGGGGGGFGANGGDGGVGSLAEGGAGGDARGSTSLTPLLGGCAGGRGGQCTASGGAGGGALQVSATGRLEVTGSLISGGSDGGSECGGQGGASGGGSGGSILLQAEDLVVSGSLECTGGRGGSGGGVLGGSGGEGSATAAGGNGGTSLLGTGGGGGGSAGRVRLEGSGSCSVGGTLTPAPSQVCP